MNTTIALFRCYLSGRMAGIYILAGVLLLLVSCHTAPVKRYGFLATLGQDTLSVESVVRQGNTLESDEVDRFPRVEIRHTVVKLNEDGSIRHLVMEIHTPSERSGERNRVVVGDVDHNMVHLSKTDSMGVVKRDFSTGGSMVVAHVQQMYSLYELYFAVAGQAAAKGLAANGSTAGSKPGAGGAVELRQFYIDREFDRFPLGHATVTPTGNGKMEVVHDWLAGTGEAVMDPTGDMLSYSGARTTYKVAVKRLEVGPDIKAIADRFAAKETVGGGVRSLSVRDSVTAQIGNAVLAINYSRPLARGRTLLGDVIPYDRVWRTGANAATQLVISAPIKLGSLQVPAGAYTLFTAPHTNGVELIVNKEKGEWGTDYNGSQDLGKVKMDSEAVTAPVEEFTISVIPGVVPGDQRHGKLVLEWGSFRWVVPIEVL